MNEGDAAAGGPESWSGVDQPIPGGAAALECAVEIGDAVADVMNPGTAPGEEFGDRRIGVARLEELDGDVAQRQGDDGGAVRLFGRSGSDAEDFAIERQCVGDPGDRDADVGQTQRGIAHQRDNLTMQTEGANGIMQTHTQPPHPTAVTDDTFGQEVEQQKGLVLVDFWATWCGPCHAVAPILEQLAGEYNGQIKVTKVDVDANQKTSMRFNVRSIPSILFFRDGRHVDTLVGAYPKAAFDEKIQQHLK